MENKENVFVQNEKTEQVAVSQKNDAELGAEEMGSAVFKKFKDVNALARAYGALEAEFTRRSQRLKELERKMEESRKSGSDDLTENKVDDNSSCGEAEKPAVEVGQEDLRSDDLENAVQPNESVGDGEELVGIGRSSLERNTAEYQDCGQGYGELVFLDGEKPSDTVVAPKAESVGLGLSDDEIYRMANTNESVRIKIVGEYLASLKKAGAPLVRGGIGTVVSPTQRARSVAEAGDMALRFFQTGK